MKLVSEGLIEEHVLKAMENVREEEFNNDSQL